MNNKQVGLLSVIAFLALILLAFDADPASAQEDPARRNGAVSSVDIGDHGGGDPDNPVPLDGDDGHGELKSGETCYSDFSPEVAIGGKSWDDLSYAIRTAVGFLDSILLF